MKNKTTLITGATSGIGEACAYYFAESGSNLILTGRNEDRLNELSKDISEKYSVFCKTLCFDITDLNATKNAFKNLIDTETKIDILINNAGLAKGLNKISESNFEDWEQMIETNIKGVLYATRLLLPSMIKNNAGHIINLSSTAGHLVYSGGNVYCGTKHFIDAITRGLKQELHGTRVRVSALSPGAVKTNFSNIRFNGDTKRADAVYANMEPMTANDIAEIALFIATRPEHVNINDVIVSATDQFLAL